MRALGAPGNRNGARGFGRGGSAGALLSAAPWANSLPAQQGTGFVSGHWSPPSAQTELPLEKRDLRVAPPLARRGQGASLWVVLS